MKKEHEKKVINLSLRERLDNRIEDLEWSVNFHKETYRAKLEALDELKQLRDN